MSFQENSSEIHASDDDGLGHREPSLDPSGDDSPNDDLPNTAPKTMSNSAAPGENSYLATLRQKLPSQETIGKFLTSYGFSALLHVGLLVVLGAFIIQTPNDRNLKTIAATFSEQQESELQPVELDLVPMDETRQSLGTPVDLDSLGEAPDLGTLKPPLSSEALARLTQPNLSADGPRVTGAASAETGAAVLGALGVRAEATARYGGTALSEAAVEMALDWLTRHQDKNGGWHFDHSRIEGCTCPNAGTNPGYTGATAVALLTYFGAGYSHADGTRADTVDRGLRFLLKRINPSSDGYADFKDGDNSIGGIYQHGLATAAIIEALSINRALIRLIKKDKSVVLDGPDGREYTLEKLYAFDDELKTAAQQAINYLLYHQDPIGGGWGYQPRSEGDTSILGWQIMALVGARAEKLFVPTRTWGGIDDFLESVTVDAGYAYKPGQDARVSTTAIGAACRMFMEKRGSTHRLKRNIDYISERGPVKNNMYYNYYATQALFGWGAGRIDERIEVWEKWNERTREMLIAMQSRTGHEKGSWHSSGHAQGGRHFNTCLAAMTLEVYYRKLPAYQRLALEPIKLK